MMSSQVTPFAEEIIDLAEIAPEFAVKAENAPELVEKVENATELVEKTPKLPVKVKLMEQAPRFPKLSDPVPVPKRFEGSRFALSRHKSLMNCSINQKPEVEAPKSFNRMKSTLFSQPGGSSKVDPRFAKGTTYYNLFGGDEDRFARAPAKKTALSKLAEGAGFSNEVTNEVGVGLIRKRDSTPVRKQSTRGTPGKGGNPVTGEGYAAPAENSRRRVIPANGNILLLNNISFCI